MDRATWSLVRRRARRAAAVIAAAGAAACIDDAPTSPDGGSTARLAVTAAVNAVSGSEIRVHVFYLRSPAGGGAETGELLDARFPLTDEQRALPISFDVTRCLADRQRTVGGPFCGVIAELELLDANATTLDRAVLDSLQARPGQTDTVPQTVRLFEVSRVDVSAPATTLVIGGTMTAAATVRDVGNNPLARAVSWSSSSDAVATVDAASGVVTARGEGTATIAAASGGKSGSIAIAVQRRPAIGLQPRALVFAGTRGSRPAAQRVLVTNTGGGTLDNVTVTGVSYAAGQPANWLDVSALDAPSAPTGFSVQPSAAVVQAPLATGSYTAFVRVAAPAASNTPDSVQVTYNVTAGPVIVVARSAIAFQTQAGSTARPFDTLTVSNGNPNGGALTGLTATVTNFTPAVTAPWLSATLGGTAAPALLSLAVTRTDLAPGTYAATVTIASTVAGVPAQTVAVTLTIARPPILRVVGTLNNFGVSGGDALPAAQSLPVTNEGDGSVEGLTQRTEYLTGSDQSWLSARLSQASATSTSPASLAVSVANSFLQPGRYTARVTVSSSTPGAGSVVVPVTLDVTVRFALVSSGGRHTCAITTSRAAYCWGDNGSGQLGDGTTTQRSVPTPVLGNRAFAELNAGESATCGITTSDAVFCWGALAGGGASPALVAQGAGYGSIAVGAAHACVTGRVAGGRIGGYCWGDNSIGQLGTGVTCRVNCVTATPQVVLDTATYLAVSAGTAHTCALNNNGVARCWGSNSDGQLGTGSSATVATSPAVIGRVSGFRLVAAGGSSSCGVVNGQAYCWGRHGESSTGTQGNIPAPVRGSPSAANLTVGVQQACAFGGSQPTCWGVNSSGEVGNGGTASTFTPATLSPTTFSQISAGGTTVFSGEFGSTFAHTCGLAAGVTYCWGANQRGQVGDGTTSSTFDRTRPVRVIGQP